MVGYLRADLLVSVLFAAGTESLLVAIPAGFILLLPVLTFSTGVLTAFTDSKLSFAAICAWVRGTVSAGRGALVAIAVATAFAASGGITVG